MLANMDVMGCHGLAVPAIVMQHVVDVESSFNRYAIGVVGGRLQRQPANLDEAVATARMLERRGYNFSLGLAQVNRSNLLRYGLVSYAQAFDACRNLQAGSRILAECHARAGSDWGKALSCYYSGDFVTGFRQGYVRKVFASMQVSPRAGFGNAAGAGEVGGDSRDRSTAPTSPASSLASRRGQATPAATVGSVGGTATRARDAGLQPVVITLAAYAGAAASRPPTTAPSGSPTSSTRPASIPLVDQAFVF